MSEKKKALWVDEETHDNVVLLTNELSALEIKAGRNKVSIKHYLKRLVEKAMNEVAGSDDD